MEETFQHLWPKTKRGREWSKSKHTRRATNLIRNGYSSQKSIRVGNLMTVPSRDRKVSLKGNNSSLRMARGPGVGRMTLDSLFPSKSLQADNSIDYCPRAASRAFCPLSLQVFMALTLLPQLRLDRHLLENLLVSGFIFSLSKQLFFPRGLEWRHLSPILAGHKGAGRETKAVGPSTNI